MSETRYILRPIREVKVNPRVFLDISINRDPPQRIVVELFAKVVPDTAENFRALCVGFESPTGKLLHYKGCLFYDILKGCVAQSGDFENQNGTGGESIYGGTFPDENFKLSHSGPGILSMANKGPNTNGSRFILTLTSQPYLDRSNVVFGKVVKGMGTVYEIGELGTCTGVPNGRVQITDCGEITEEPQRSFGVFFVKVVKGGETTYKFEPAGTSSSGVSSGRVQITDSGDISEDKKSNMIESDKPQCSSVRKEESEAKLQKDIFPRTLQEEIFSKKLQEDDFSKIFEWSVEKVDPTLKKNVLVTNQHSDDPTKSRGDQSPVRNRSKKSESPISEDKKNNATQSDKGKSKKTWKRAITLDGGARKQYGSTVSDKRKKRRKYSSSSSDSESSASESDSFLESDSDSSSSGDRKRRKKRSKKRSGKQNNNKRKTLTARSSKGKFADCSPPPRNRSPPRDRSPSRCSQRPACSPRPRANISGNLESRLGPRMASPKRPTSRSPSPHVSKRRN